MHGSLFSSYYAQDVLQNVFCANSINSCMKFTICRNERLRAPSPSSKSKGYLAPTALLYGKLSYEEHSRLVLRGHSQLMPVGHFDFQDFLPTLQRKCPLISVGFAWHNDGKPSHRAAPKCNPEICAGMLEAGSMKRTNVNWMMCDRMTVSAALWKV